MAGRLNARGLVAQSNTHQPDPNKHRNASEGFHLRGNHVVRIANETTTASEIAIGCGVLLALVWCAPVSVAHLLGLPPEVEAGAIALVSASGTVVRANPVQRLL